MSRYLQFGTAGVVAGKDLGSQSFKTKTFLVATSVRAAVATEMSPGRGWQQCEACFCEGLFRCSAVKTLSK
jgi:hypothetical protein